VFAVAFSPDHQLVAAGDSSGSITLWNRETGQSAHQPFHASDGVRSVAFSHAGTLLVSGGDDKVGRVWDIRTRQQILALEGHGDYIRSITFSPNGHFIISGSDDRTMRLWDVATGAPLAIIHGHGGYVMSVMFTLDGQFIVSASEDSTIRVWNVEKALSRSSDSDDDPTVALEHTGFKDGWILSKSGQMLLWVPAEYRTFLGVPTCTAHIAKHRIVVQTGETWYRGEKWADCWRGSSTA